MRHSSISAFIISLGIVLISTTAPFQAEASGNVLLPSGSSDTSSPPNLGIGGATTTPSTSASPPSSAQTPQADSPPPTDSPASSSTQQTPPAAQQPTSTMSVPAPASARSYITTPNSSRQAGDLPPGSLPTHVIHIPETASLVAQLQKKLPYAVTVGFAHQSIFGADDVTTLGKKLGLSSSQISSTCTLTARGVITTDKGSYIIFGGNASQFQVRYDGTISGIQISGIALCAVDQNLLPPGSGYLTETSGRIDVPLQPVQCHAPNHQISTITITYNGTSESQCAFN